ncbi:MAG: DegT/DnrJ/EryC1/StrS family aminotransferase [Kiritimatiellae bacterium]|nr:DegT/DnrJ/EryC1/StrS family aminotransferase [Kiritimatiellia bacterium]
MAGPGAEYIGTEEKLEALDVLASGYLFRYGRSDDARFKAKVWNLEREFCDYVGAKHGLAVNSGTSALLASLIGLEIGAGDEVIVPGYTFIASISSIVYAGGIPVLAEIDESLNLDPMDLERRITERTKAIMAVHMLGNPAKMDAIMEIANRRGIPVIEDAAQACGGVYRGKKLGTIGKIGAYSFNFYKTMTCGDGGMMVTDDEEVYTKGFGFHDQGHLPNRQGVEIGKRSAIGLDFRMNELTGAVALAQLRKLDAVLNHLRAIKKTFKEKISGLKGIQFREITDAEGECATVLTIILPDREEAKTLARRLDTPLLINSGWHVYRNMEQILCREFKTLDGQVIKYEKGMLPRTEDILRRSMNLTIGLRDRGIGAVYGLGPKDTTKEAESKGYEFAKIVRETIG